jgi:hypothetical protein
MRNDEVLLARLISDGAKQLTQQKQAAAAEQQAQQKAQDPIIQMQQQELQLNRLSSSVKLRKIKQIRNLTRQDYSLMQKKPKPPLLLKRAV